VHPWSTALHWAEVALGALWLYTGFAGGGARRFGRQLARAGLDPRAAGPALWIQRGLGALLLVLGIWGLRTPR
jgi:hypothetical protein